MYHLSTENTRINTVSVALKRCDIKTLFREINNSEQSMERFWDIGTEHKFLANTARNTDGIAPQDVRIKVFGQSLKQIRSIIQ